VSLTDSAGGVCRLLGKAEDITQRKICALRFQALASKQKKLPAGILAVIGTIRFSKIYANIENFPQSHKRTAVNHS